MNLPPFDPVTVLQLQQEFARKQELERKRSAIEGGCAKLATALFQDVAMLVLSLEPDHDPSVSRETLLKVLEDRLYRSEPWSEVDSAILIPTRNSFVFRAKVYTVFNFVREWIEAAQAAERKET